jgi:DNA adenine methylase
VESVAPIEAPTGLPPWLKWPGGKRDLAPMLVPEILATRPALYVEPFLGGGAVALALPAELPKILSDVNPALIDCWLCVQKIPGALYAELCAVEDRYGDHVKGYLDARAEFNTLVHHPRRMWAHRAALFMFLNARCFNGLWRTNSKGLFNVPFGKRENPVHFEAEALACYTAHLNRTTIQGYGFARTIGDELTKRLRGGRGRVSEMEIAARGLAIYADPPYHETFGDYAKDGFTDDDQRALAQLLGSAAAMGAAVWTTNSDTPLIREIYAWAQIAEINEHHSIGSKAERRGKRTCLLIRGGDAEIARRL